MNNSVTNYRRSHADQQQKLLVNGWVNLLAAESPVEITRGMLIVSRDDQELGKVAAVAVNNLTQEVTHILLCRLPLSPDYRLVSLNLVAQVSEEIVKLHIQGQDVDGLTTRHPT